MLRRGNSSLQILRSSPSRLPLPHPPIRMKLGDRWFIPGTSGCGKTSFAIDLTNQIYQLYPTARVFVLAIKDDGTFDNWPNFVRSEAPPPMLKRGERVQVWMPIRRRPQIVDAWLGEIKHANPAFLLVDEGIAVQDGKNLLDEYAEILQTGRSLHLGSATLIQKISKFPQDAFAQAVHICRFRLIKAYDRTAGDELVRKERKGEPPDPYGFYYARTDNTVPGIYYKDKSEFF